MSKLIRHAQKRGTALFLAMQLTGLIVLSLLSFIGGPQSRDGGTPADSQANVAQAQTQTAQASPTISRSALRFSAMPAVKLYEPLASQVFNLATQRAAAAQNTQGPELPNEATLTTDQEDYPPFSYVYFTGT